MSSARFPTGQRGLPLPVVQGEEEFMEKLIEALQEIPEAAELLHCRGKWRLSGGHDGPGTGAPCPCLRGECSGAGKAASSGGVQ